MINKELYRSSSRTTSSGELLIETQKFPPESSNYSPDYRIDRSHHESNLEYIRQINITRCKKKKMKANARVKRLNQKEREFCSVLFLDERILRYLHSRQRLDRYCNVSKHQRDWCCKLKQVQLECPEHLLLCA